MDINEDLQVLIGIRIYEIRVKNKKTQNDLGFLMGMDPAEVSKYESGKINLTLGTLIRFAQALKVHPREFFDFEFNIENYKVNN
ncbi:helix-turn-helix transcriptional regulator [Myroides odoratimimus]|uniref:helix-turn-helix domain-containing protein n=1 Tax=Myroides odoratimimus TaxID=76832 RepID=UPI00310147B7